MDTEDHEVEALIIDVRPATGSWVAPAHILSRMEAMSIAGTLSDFPSQTQNYIVGLRMAEFEGSVFFYFEPDEGCSASGLKIDSRTMDEVAMLWCRARKLDPMEHIRRSS